MIKMSVTKILNFRKIKLDLQTHAFQICLQFFANSSTSYYLTGEITNKTEVDPKYSWLHWCISTDYYYLLPCHLTILSSKQGSTDSVMVDYLMGLQPHYCTSLTHTLCRMETVWLCSLCIYVTNSFSLRAASESPP